MEISAPLGTRTNWRNVTAAASAIAVFGFALGQMFPLLSLLLERQGYSDDLIGINSAMSPIGILLASPFITPLARRLGTRRMALIAAFLTMLIILAYKALPSIEAWFVLRLAQGMCVSTLFVLSEAWIVKYAAGGQRGRIVALYASVLSASFAAGPALIAWIGIEGWLPFLIGAAVMAAAMLPLSLVQDEHAPNAGAHRTSFFTFAPKAPVLLSAVAMFAIFDAATLSLLPVYGVRIGLDVSTSAQILTALIVGNVALQMPLGWLADVLPKRLVMGGCAVVTAILCFAMPASMGTLLMWPLLLVMGAAGYGIYTIALAELGDRFKGDELVQGSAAFATVWGAGALVGSALAGWAMAVFGPHGLPLVLGVSFVIFFAGIIARARLGRK
ncbi:MAG: MFS transporter [Parvibaculaceae bacterium]